MRVTVLGKSPAWADEGGACSGYLVREGDFTLLLDCGSGVLGQLRRHCDYLDVDAVIISHLHPDHFIDLVAFSFALGYSPRQLERRTERPGLLAPPGSRDALRPLMGVWGKETQLEEVFAFEEYDPARERAVGPFTVCFCQVPHYDTPTFACELHAPGGARLTFGADCCPNDPLATFARGTDLLLVEATLSEIERSDARGHMLPYEAGQLARRAQARRVVLTHFSDELDAEWVRREGERGFGAALELARPGAEWQL